MTVDQDRAGWTVLKKTLEEPSSWENIWKAKNDTVRLCRGQRTVGGVGSTGSYTAESSWMMKTWPLTEFRFLVKRHSYLTLPYLRGGCLLGRHPALRPQHGPSAHPRRTSRSIEPLWSFGKPQEEKPMDITQRIQWQSKITKYCFPKKH